MEHNIDYETTTTLDIQRETIRPPLMTTVFTIMMVSQLPVRNRLTAGRVFKGDYSIGLTVLPLFIFIFSGVLYVLQKKIKSLFILYR